jgi:hypothetical protein
VTRDTGRLVEEQQPVRAIGARRHPHNSMPPAG